MHDPRDTPSHEPPSPEAIALGHEPTAIGLRALVWFLVIFVAAAVVIHVIVWFLMIGFERGQATADPPVSPLAVPANRPPPPEPLLQPSPAQPEPRQPWQDMKTYLARESERLDSYGPTDPLTGAAQIPIGRAMELLANRLPTTRPAGGGK